MRFTCWSNRSLRKGVADRRGRGDLWRYAVMLGIWWFESAPKHQDPPGSTRVLPCFFVGDFRVFRNKTIEQTWFSPLLVFTSSGLTETGVHGSTGLVKQSTRLVRLVSKISSCSWWGIANCHVWLRYVEGMSHVKFLGEFQAENNSTFRRVLPCGMPNPPELNKWNLEKFASADHGIFMDFLMGQLVKLLAKSRSGNPIAFLGKIIYFNDGGSSFLCSSTTDSSATKSINKAGASETGVPRFQILPISQSSSKSSLKYYIISHQLWFELLIIPLYSTYSNISNSSMSSMIAILHCIAINPNIPIIRISAVAILYSYIYIYIYHRLMARSSWQIMLRVYLYSYCHIPSIIISISGDYMTL